MINIHVESALNTFANQNHEVIRDLILDSGNGNVQEFKECLLENVQSYVEDNYAEVIQLESLEDLVPFLLEMCKAEMFNTEMFIQELEEEVEFCPFAMPVVKQDW